ncbi:ninja-family protein 4 [Cajanus cajan]|uniref:Ninja-family protein n=1 Tax=Cajanus cajan TaxID=3821 RepID=A0A151SXC6_CAJCA|nr:ninja-family protein 4 [Cajanus cajan]KYP59411.1 UPF0737 protein AFP3 [Cajanus cajan]
MVQVEEIELDLGLSIGGNHIHMVEEKAAPHHHHKRDIQALPRMEAKKKRQQKREREPQWEHQHQHPFKRSTPLHHFTFPFCLPTPNNLAVNSSSSPLSDYQTSSREEGGSSDSQSHSVHSLAEASQMKNCKEMSIGSQAEESGCASSYPMRPEQRNNTQERKHIVLETQAKPAEPQKQETTPTSIVALSIENSSTNTNTNPLVETKVDITGKPPQPLSQASSLPQMPYVSTKGTNGKTVNGFLYRYTKSEVSIVCVCHGSTFSPAEFVQHAGGTDISHPLRHITVIPSAFG